MCGKAHDAANLGVYGASGILNPLELIDLGTASRRECMDKEENGQSVLVPSSKPLQNLSNDLIGSMNSRTVSRLTQVRDIA